MLLFMPGVVPHASQAVVDALRQLLMRQTRQGRQAEDLKGDFRKQLLLGDGTWWRRKTLNGRLAKDWRYPLNATDAEHWVADFKDPGVALLGNGIEGDMCPSDG